ncbi:hypothetical protein [Corynebacterium sp. AOP12-C2-36]|uniref:hypothetical protein n=1 Tax=Corynebacterium sp. AOP12-C2-36 TaxID=3457723 RepID=UPI004034A2C7
MPVAPITPDPGADGWGRPAPGPVSGSFSGPPSLPPNADPDGRFRPAAVGGHRTARWFILVGVVLVALVVPFAVPMNPSPDTEPYLLNEAAADSLLSWDHDPLDLTALDPQCVATGDAMLPGTLEAECADRFGNYVDLDIMSMNGVGDEDGDTTQAARRSMRAIFYGDMSGATFTTVDDSDAADLLHPTLAARTTEVLTTPVLELEPTLLNDPDGFFDDFEDGLREPASPDTHPVQYGDSDGSGSDGSTGSGLYTAAASFLLDGPERVLYTVTVTGDDADVVAAAAEQLLGSVRAA